MLNYLSEIEIMFQKSPASFVSKPVSRWKQNSELGILEETHCAGTTPNILIQYKNMTKFQVKIW